MKKNPIISIVLYVIFFCQFNLLSAQAIISQPEYRYLYAFYENTVYFGGASGLDEIVYEVKNAHVRKEKEDHFMYVTPDEGVTEVIFSFFNRADNKLINEVKFGVRKLPEPELMYKFGQSKMIIGYGPEFPLNSAQIKYTVKEWKLKVVGSDAKPLTGNGPILSSAAIVMMTRAAKETTFLLEVNYEGAGIKDGHLAEKITKGLSDEIDPLLADEDLSEERTTKVVEQLGIVGLPELMILYHNYDNILQIGSANGQVLKVTAENVILTQKANNTYLARPVTDARQGRVIVHTSTGIDTAYFRIHAFPEPTISISNLQDLHSNPPGFSDYQLSVGYPPETPLNPEYKITSWSISLNSDVAPFTGNGSRLPSTLIQKMKQQEGDRKIYVTCHYEGNGMTSSVSKVFSY